MKKLPLFVCALILASLPVARSATKDVPPMATPSEDSKALAAKQLETKLGELKEALGGMQDAIGKGDRASFILYRTQAKTALAAIDKIGTIQMGSETSGEHKAAKEGKMSGTPTPTPTPEATPTPTPESTPTPTPEMTPTPTPTPTPEATPTPK
jgi:outer membrane biosynthesis protein TonB